MKKVLLWLMVGVFILSMTFMGIGCKTTTAETTAAAAETTAAAAETTAAETTAAETTAGEVIKIVYSNWQNEEAVADLFYDTFNQFQEENPQYKIENLFIPADVTNQMLMGMQIAGNSPDVSYTSSVTPFNLDAIAPGLVDLNKYLSPEFKADIYAQTFIKDFTTEDGRLLSVPIVGGGSYILWYNKKILEKAGVSEPPKTMDELMDVCAKIKATQPDVFPIGIDNVLDGVAQFEMFSWAWSFGARPLEGEPPLINTPEMKEFVTYYRELAEKGYMPPPGNSVREYREYFAHEKICFYMDGPYAKVIMPGIDEKWGDSAVFDETFACTFVPMTDKVTVPQVASDDGCLVVSANTKHPEEVVKFVEKLVSGSFPSGYNMGIYTVMPLKSQNDAEKDYFDNNPHVKWVLDEVVPIQQLPPYGPKYAAYSQVLLLLMQDTQAGTKSIDDILTDAETKCMEIYNKQ